MNIIYLSKVIALSPQQGCVALCTPNKLTGELDPLMSSAIYVDLIINYLLQVKLASNINGVSPVDT